MASAQGSAQYARSSYGQYPASHTLTTGAPFSTQLPAPVAAGINLGMPTQAEASSQPPPLPPQGLRLPTGRLSPPAFQLGASASHGLHAQTHGDPLARQLPSLNSTHIVEQQQAQHNGHHQVGVSQAGGYSQTQQRQYGNFNGIPNMLPGSTVTSLSGGAPQGHGQQNAQGMQSFQMGMTGADWNSSGSGAMPGMQSLMNPHRVENSNTHHTSSTVPPHSQHLGSVLSSSLAPGGSLLNGAVDKRRRNERTRSDLGHHLPLLKTEDQQALLLGAPRYEPTILLPPAPASSSDSPVVEYDGIQFKKVNNLPEAKVRRLRDEKIKPVELLTFEDIKTYNRNQLRAYCFVYGVKRRRKADMEANMAKYASLFHPGDPAYDYSKFAPAEYVEGAIPRRRTPVTKEQRERAAGDALALVPNVPRRAPMHFDPVYNAGVQAGAFSGASIAHPPPLPPHPAHPLARAFDVHGGAPVHHLPAPHMAAHQPAPLHQPASHGGMPPGTGGGEDMAAPGGHDLVNMSDPLHVQNQILGLANQIADE